MWSGLSPQEAGFGFLPKVQIAWNKDWQGNATHHWRALKAGIGSPVGQGERRKRFAPFICESRYSAHLWAICLMFAVTDSVWFQFLAMGENLFIMPKFRVKIQPGFLSRLLA